MTSRPSTAAPILAVLAIVLVTLGTYVGGYLALLKVRVVYTIDSGIEYERHFLNYRIDGKFITRLFYPINQVDRRLRPEHWRNIERRIVASPP
jgi:hypothetical protein